MVQMNALRKQKAVHAWKIFFLAMSQEGLATIDAETLAVPSSWGEGGWTLGPKS